MRTIYRLTYTFALLLAALSCAKEIEEKPALPASEGFEHDGKVTFTFTPQIDGLGARTKAFGRVPADGGGNSTIRNIYFAVFDANGYKLSEYANAVPNTYATQNGVPYSYSVELTVTDQPRIVHIIANAPDRISYGSEAEVIGSLTTSFNSETWDGDDAYWTRIYLENGVWAQPDPAEAGVIGSGYAERLAKFIEVRDQLSTAKLVRNFSMITVINSASTNFQATRFWLTNIPDKGSIAPYNRNTGQFQIDYSTYTSVDKLRGTGTGEGNYQGFNPASIGLCNLSGKTTSWLDSHASTISSSEGGSAYCFEREVPRTNPLYVIVGGKYDSDADGEFTDEDESFYKIDLRDSLNNYFPILRNFDYRINVNTVSSRGSSTVEAALAAAPSGDISTSIGLQELTNISNGVSQIIVSETSKVLVGTTSGTDDVTLHFKYIPNLNDKTAGVPNVCNNILTDAGDITAAKAAHTSYVTIQYSSGSTGDIFDHAGTPWDIGSTDDSEGFREITFHPVAASDIVRTEEITLVGHYWNPSAGASGAWEQMSRVVTYRLRERLSMTLSLSPDKVPAAEGEPMDLVIGIESGLPSSVFTLDMKVEAGKLSVTSNGDALPVSTGASTIPGSTSKSAFTFTKAITWEEYSATPTVIVGDVGYKYFTCHFKTNTATIAGSADDLYVSNPYFNQNHIGFTTYTAKTFSAVTLSDTTPDVGDDLTFGFTMSALPSDGKVYIKLKGYEPGDASKSVLTFTGTDSEGYEIYQYTASTTTVSGLHLTPYMPGECAIRLEADEFRPDTSEQFVSEGQMILILPDVKWVSLTSPTTDLTGVGSPYSGQQYKLTVYVNQNGLSDLTIGGKATTRTGAGSNYNYHGVTFYPYITTTAFTATLANSAVGEFQNVTASTSTRAVTGKLEVWGLKTQNNVTDYDSWQAGSALTSTSAITSADKVAIRNYSNVQYLSDNGSLTSSASLSGSTEIWEVTSGYNVRNISTGKYLHYESNTFSVNSVATNLGLSTGNQTNTYYIRGGASTGRYLRYNSGLTANDGTGGTNSTRNSCSWYFYSVSHPTINRTSYVRPSITDNGLETSIATIHKNESFTATYTIVVGDVAGSCTVSSAKILGVNASPSVSKVGNNYQVSVSATVSMAEAGTDLVLPVDITLIIDGKTLGKQYYYPTKTILD